MEPITAGTIAGPIAIALGEAVLSKGVEVAARLLSDPSWRKTLATRAATEAGIPAAAEAVHAWLELAETPSLLASQNAARNFTRLHETLVQELANQWASRVGTLPG